jgi:hypothetical protein
LHSRAPLAPYSPDLSHCDFHLFQKLKSRIKGCNLKTLESVQKAVTDAIKTLTEADFQSCYEAWKFGPNVLHQRDFILKEKMLI